ncbi:hypothetical protein BpHYR1_001448 [Brachionus plicatilis]|uniref:Uncharacterized protein n=1 Tax=Brachionus plicatilis TaxID=10195 RepID=A0A3M7T495_BRAPC|nr:hypothetical protein BpHYR1_001448 [Brachionus plicatilis]
MGKIPCQAGPFGRKLINLEIKKEYKTNREKGKIFGDFLASTFSPNADLIDPNKDRENFFFKNERNQSYEPIKMTELILALKKLREEAAAGPDQIHNIMLKNLPQNTLNEITFLFNTSLEQEWLYRWKMKISVEKSCYMVFSKYTRGKIHLHLEIHGNKLDNQKEVKFLGVKFDSALTFTPMVEEIRELSNRLFELSERYVRAGLSHSVRLVIRLVNEYREGFESRFIEYPTPLCNCYLEH